MSSELIVMTGLAVSICDCGISEPVTVIACRVLVFFWFWSCEEDWPFWVLVDWSCVCCDAGLSWANAAPVTNRLAQMAEARSLRFIRSTPQLEQIVQVVLSATPMDTSADRVGLARRAARKHRHLLPFTGSGSRYAKGKLALI